MASRLDQNGAAAAAVSADAEELALWLALHSLGIAANPLPDSPLAWMKYLWSMLTSNPPPTHSHQQRIARALTQLIFTGSFDGADLFKRLHGEAVAPVSTPVPKFLEQARVSFPIGTIPATADQKLFYMRCLASVVKRGFRLTDALPPGCSELSTFMIEAPSDESSTAPQSSAYYVVTVAERRMTALGQLADRHASSASRWTAPEKHAFLAVWAFMTMSVAASASATALTAPYVDPISLRAVCASAGSPSIRDFVANAA